MADDGLQAAERSQDSAPDVRLDSWKEIAAYLKRDVTTVRRWEKREGLPVHRHLHERRDSVYGYAREIDTWWQGRRNQLAQNGALDLVTPGPEDESSTSARVPKPDRPSPRRGRGRVAWALASTFCATTLLLTTVVVFLLQQRTPGAGTEARFSVFAPDETSFGTASLSPDGRQLAFTAAADAGGKTLLWVRPLNTIAARSLPDTDGATFPFWSATSDALGFFAAGKLWTIDLSGGNPRVVCDAPEGRGGTWNREGIIVFAPGPRGPLLRVPAAGGSPAAVTTVERKERGHVWPEFLPDGNHFLYLADSSEPEHHNLFVGSFNGDRRTRLLTLASSAAYGGGYLLFARDRQLVAQPFDATRLALTGDPVTLAEHVVQPWDMDHKTEFSVSNTGVLMYRSLGGFDTELVWRDRSEHHAALASRPAGYSEPTLSPDQTRVAVDIFDSRPSRRFGFGVTNITSDIWLLNRSTGAASQFTFDPAADFDPVWSPDGTRIVFSSNRRGSLDLYQKNTDGTGADQPLLRSSVAKHAQAWSPDGRFLVYATLEEKTRFDLWLLPMIGDRTPTPLLRTEFSEQQAHISPDSRWFSYTSTESGRSEVYVQSFPSPAGKWQISTNGGGDARWGAHGRELFYIAEDRRLMAVAVKTGATFEHGSPVPLFDTGMQPHWGTSRNHYDVSSDGQRFLLMTPVADDRSSPFTIVVNWTATLPK